jgi:hypothetical protein
MTMNNHRNATITQSQSTVKAQPSYDVQLKEFISLYIMPHSSNDNSILKIIFLDIDGVLLPFPHTGKNRPEDDGFLFPKSTMNALKRLLQFTQAEIVLSSTWRSQPSFVQDILKDFEKHELEINEFCSMTDPNFHSERQWEIHKWLRENASSSKKEKLCWLALDDEELIEGEKNESLRSFFQDHIIKTESALGLTEADVDLGMPLWEAQLARQWKSMETE